MSTNLRYDLVAQNTHSTVVSEYTQEYGMKKKHAEKYQSEAELEKEIADIVKDQNKLRSAIDKIVADIERER